MRHTEFWRRMEAALGTSYARTWAETQAIADLGGLTVAEALADGESPKHIWRAVWAKLELPLRER